MENMISFIVCARANTLSLSLQGTTNPGSTTLIPKELIKINLKQITLLPSGGNYTGGP